MKATIKTMMPLALSLICFSAISQVYDYRTNTLTSPDAVRAGSPLTVEIRHLNPYHHTANITVENMKVELESLSLIDNILKAISLVEGLPTSGALPPVTVPSALSDALSVLEKALELSGSLPNPNSAILKDAARSPSEPSKDESLKLATQNNIVKKYKETLDRIRNASKDYNGVIKGFSSTLNCLPDTCIDVRDECTWYNDVDTVLQRIDELKVACMEYLAKYKADKDPFIEAVANLLKQLEANKSIELFNNFKNQVAEYKSANCILEGYARLLGRVREIDARLMALSRNDLDTTTVVLAPRSTPSWLNSGNLTKVNTYEAALRALDTLNMLCTNYLHEHQATNATCLKVVESIKSNLDTGSFKKIFREFYQLVFNYDPSLFTYTSIPLVVEGDEVNYSIQIAPRDSLHFPTSRIVDINRTIDVYWYWQPSFSSGLFLSYLTDENYLIRSSQTDETILEEGNSKVDFGVNALTHYAFKLSPSVGLGAHLGAGIILKENPSLQLLFGGSMIIGKDNRWALNAGVAVGRREVLFDNLETDIPYTKPIGTITKKITDIGFQFSLTYNFTIGGN